MKNLGNIVNDLDVATKGYVDKKIKNLGGGTGGGGGASIPVVSSEEELESLSQNKGDLAVILSDDEIKSGKVRCLDLPSISMDVVQQFDFSECASVQGIAINTEVDVPPCPAFAGQNIQFIIAPRKMSGLLDASYLGFDLSEPFDEDGYCRGTLQVTMIQGGSGSSAMPLAQYDETTGKMVLVDDGTIEELNSLVIGTMLEDPVLVSMTEMVEFGGEGLKDTLAFFECISSVVKLGTKAIRVKNDDGYSRLDSDIVKVIDKKAAGTLDALKMPKGSLVRVHYPEEAKYDTDIATMRCCITEPEFDSSKATVLNKVEFTRACTTEKLEDDATPLPPYFVLTDRSGSQFFEVVFEMGGDGNIPLAVKGSMDGGTYLYLLQNGVWNEELIEEFNAIVSGGVNVLYKLGKAGQTMWNPETGVCTYLEQGGLGEETMSQISMIMEMMIGAYVQFRYNERVIPEHIESYSRLEGKWVKDEMEIETEWSESSLTSNKPIATSLFAALMRDYDDDIRKELDSKQSKLVSGQNIATVNGKSLLEGGNIVIEGGEGGGSNITVDSVLSTTSTNPVQNAVITTELNKKVNAVSGKGLSTNDYTTTEKNKLSSIAANAEVNVQSDWNATGGDAFIKNKPTFATINGKRIDQGGEIAVGGGASSWDEISDKPTFAKVATTGSYKDLNNTPTFATINGKPIVGGGNIQLGGAVIFDATCANDIYDLPALQTTTEVQTIIDAIATSQPIYAQFSVSMIPATIAYLTNGFPNLLLQTVDAEDGKARMVHIYAYEEGWTWERFEMELGGASGTFVKSVNGVTPDGNGNVQIDVTIDGEVGNTTLSTLVGSGSTFTLEELIG